MVYLMTFVAYEKDMWMEDFRSQVSPIEGANVPPSLLELMQVFLGSDVSREGTLLRYSQAGTLRAEMSVNPRTGEPEGPFRVWHRNGKCLWMTGCTKTANRSLIGLFIRNSEANNGVRSSNAG